MSSLESIKVPFRADCHWAIVCWLYAVAIGAWTSFAPLLLSADSDPSPQEHQRLAENAWAILESKCFSCHGPSKQKSSYRIDHIPTALKGGDFGEPAIIPLDTKNSLLLKLVSRSQEPSMPPADSGVEPLSPEQVSTLEHWIEAGAPWPRR